MKSKSTATLLCLFLGGIGIHQFYLGRKRGILYLLFCWTFIPLAISVIDLLMLLGMSNAEFNRQYNTELERSLKDTFIQREEINELEARIEQLKKEYQ